MWTAAVDPQRGHRPSGFVSGGIRSTSALVVAVPMSVQLRSGSYARTMRFKRHLHHVGKALRSVRVPQRFGEF